VIFEFLVIAIHSLAGVLCPIPFLALGKAVELVASAAARMMVEFRESVEIGCDDDGHS
jgi:hypothetical protein